ncbi:MAG: YceI family protein [Acidobacteria bacterium]|nr:YceI family protein [Acidobacteriota bacterium]
MFKKALAVTLVAVLWVAAYAAVPMTTDSAHSNVSFSLPILGGLSKVTGKFGQFSADINFDEKDITKSSVVAKIKTDSISTGIGARDNHLKTADFFNAEKYPEITFTSKKVEKKGGKLILTGDFSMHGVTKEISFPFTVHGNCADKKAAAAAPPCGFKASLQLNRKDYGIAYERKDNPDFMGDVVNVELDILTRTPPPAKPQ